MTNGLARPMPLRGYKPSDQAFLEVARRGPRIVGATNTGFYAWSERTSVWARRRGIFEQRNVDGSAPTWVADIVRISSTQVRAVVPSPWRETEWLVAGDAGIVAVSDEDVRWVWRVSKGNPAGLISSMAVAKGLVWVGF
jgi:hypothetical protein